LQTKEHTVSSGADAPAHEDALLGRWTYRSLMSNPDIDVDFNDLEFGRGELLVEYVCWGKFVGRLVLGDDYELRLTGTIEPGDPPTISLDGFGDAVDSNGLHYQYFGCLMPLWPHDPRKRPTIVGSVTRAAPKEGSEDRPGSASTFVAIKHNPLPDPEAAKPADTSTAAPTPGGSPGDGAEDAEPGSGPSGGGADGPTGTGASHDSPAGGGSSAHGATGGDRPVSGASPAPGAGGYETESEKPGRR
jgi:hypothetical protein